MRGQPVQDILADLVRQRGRVPDHHSDLSRLDESIIPLMIITRNMSGKNALNAGPYDIGHDDLCSIPGISFLHDLTEDDLQSQLSDLLEVKYLEVAHEPTAWPVRGVLFGPCKRPVVCLPTKLRRTLINVFYLVDTGAHTTELSPSAFSALGSESIPSAAYAVINGFKNQVRLCSPTGNHPEIPMLGADFMTEAGIVLTVNYKDKTCSLDLAI
eukprot:352149-Chlamydomonas_euryale.AAC.15